MAQFTIDKKLVAGEIKLANYDEIEKELKTTLERYKEFKVSNETYVEAKTKRAELNRFDKTLNRIRIDTKKEFLTPYETFENQIKYLSSLVAKASDEIDDGIKAIDDREISAKIFDITTFFNEMNLPIVLDKVYKKEWENKGYSFDTIKDEILQLKAQIDKDLDYISKHVANDDLILKARIKGAYLESLDLISSIDKETEKTNQVKAIVKDDIVADGLEVKDIDVILTVNSKQWYQIQNFINSIGAKMRKK